MPIATTNPATGEVLKTFSPLKPSEIEEKIGKGQAAFERARRDPGTVARRAQSLVRVAELLERNAAEYGRVLTLEMGKTWASAQEEVKKCALGCRYNAEFGPRALAPELVDLGPGAPSRAEIRHLPLGVVLAVMPWNFPFWQVFRCAAPILLSGNSMLLKHASNVPQSALLIEKIFREAGMDEGAFHALLIGSDQVESVIADPRVRGATLTGSEGAGREVARIAGTHLKKTVLELGGSDPLIVMPSADVTKAAKTAAQSRTLNNGQSCISAKRFLVHEKVYAEFRERFLAALSAMEVGDPMESATQIGPLSGERARADLHELVTDAVACGATLSLGGHLPEGRGFYYPATVLENIPEKAKIYSEEAFGPVASLYRVQSLEEAIRLANSSRFGLGGAIWSKDEEEIRVATTLIESGSVYANSLVASHPRLPFGGVKDSGYGREMAYYGLREFTNIKTVSIAD